MRGWREVIMEDSAETGEGADDQTVVHHQHVQTALGDRDADEREEEINEIVVQVGEISKPRQAVHFFVDIKSEKVGSQQIKATCLFCRKGPIASTGAARLVDHLIACDACPKPVKAGFKSLRDTTGTKRKLEQEAAALREEEKQLAAVQHEAAQATLKQQCIKAGLKTAQQSAADLAIAKFFFANGVSFSTADPSSTGYFREMCRAIKEAPASYIPPEPKKLGGPLLDECHKEMWSKIKERDPDGALANKFGSTYVSDGWDSIDNLPLINSAFITANDGGVYWRSVDTSGYEKNAEYCAALMIADIYEFGCDKVILIVTDTCNTMKKCWTIVLDEFPWMSVLPCQPHVVSLLLKDIGSMPKFTSVIKEEATIVNWFSHHQKPLAVLREKTRATIGKAKELIRAAATRFGSNTLVGKRLLELQGSLQATVVDPDYVAQKYADTVGKPDADGEVRETKGGTAKKLVLDDTGFWATVQEHVDLTSPMMDLLRRHDSSAPSVGKVYAGWFDIGVQIRESGASCKQKIEEEFDKRWAYGHEPFAAAAYVLDPEFRNHQQSGNEEVMEGFMDTIEKIGLLMEVRKKRDEFKKDWELRKKLIESDPKKQKTLDHYPNYPANVTASVQQFASKVSQQLNTYRTGKGTFSRKWVLDSASKIPAYEWWSMYGGSVPELQQVACLILSQPASASIIERINSEFAFIKDKRRNRLAHDKANKLVGLFHNLRLLAKMSKPKYSEPAVGWFTEKDSGSAVTVWKPGK